MRPSTSATNHSLLQRAQQQDQDAWHQLVELYGPLIHHWCRQVGLQDDDAADIFQETFRAVARSLSTFKPKHAVGSFRSWLKQIVRNKIIDHARKASTRPKAVGGSTARDELAAMADPLANETEDDSAHETALLVQRAMELIRPEFSPQNWRAFQMVVIDGQAATEVAETLGVSAPAIRQANYRIRRRLKVVLHDVVEE